MTPWQKPSVLLASAAWISTFALAWLLALGKLPCDGPTLSAWLFFFGIAVAASAMALPDKKGNDGS